jgi:PAS domain S-box-containing protein
MGCGRIPVAGKVAIEVETGQKGTAGNDPRSGPMATPERGRLTLVIRAVGSLWILPALAGAVALAVTQHEHYLLGEIASLVVAVFSLFAMNAWALLELGRSVRTRAHPELAELVWSSPTATYAFDVDQRKILHANDAFCALLGYGREELEGRVGLDLVPEWALARSELGLDHLKREGQSHAREVPWLRSDGTLVWMDLYSRALDGGANRLALISLHDITERRAMEEELERRSEAAGRINRELMANIARLRQSEAHHRALFAQATDAVFLVEAETGLIREANPEALRLAGMEGQAVAGKSVGMLDGQGLRRLAGIVQDTVRGAGAQFQEVPVRRHDGRMIYVDLGAALVTDGDERLVQLTMHDVTDRRRLREELERTNRQLDHERGEMQRANAQLARGNAIKSQFLANMSHEIRTPLNAINGFAELLADDSFGRLTEQQQGFVTRIIDAGQHLLQLINDVIDLAKVEAGTIVLDLQPVNVARAADQAVKIIRGMARSKGVSVNAGTLEETPMALADERRVKQVLFNLLSNAIRFAPEGTNVDLVVAQEGEWIRVDVSDKGVGVAPEEHERIFEEFVQIGPPDVQLGGAGLGLPLSRNLVRLHGGDLTVESTPGQGSTFSFTLPVAHRPEEEIEVEVPTAITQPTEGYVARN